MRICSALLLLILTVGPLGTREATAASLIWFTNRTEAVTTAKSQGKLLLLLAGRDTCSNCRTMKTIVAESENPPLKALINDYFIPWYSDIDASLDYLDYTDGMSTSWVLPLICVIDPNQPTERLDRSTGVQQAFVFYQRLLSHANALMIQPRITGFDPVQGGIGTHVSITGHNLTNVTQVLFNGIPASFTMANAGVVQAEVPAGASSGPIRVITACGEATSSDTFVVLEGGVIVVHYGQLIATNQSFLAVFYLMVSNQGSNLVLDLHLTNALALGEGLNVTNWPATNLTASLPYTAEASQGTHALANDVFHWHLGNLTPGAQATLALRLSPVPAGRLNSLVTYALLAANPIVTNQSSLAYVDVPVIPALVIQKTGIAGQLALTWPGIDPRWKLEATDNFPIPGPPLWREVPEIPQGTQSQTITLTNTLASGTQFFRLVFDPSLEPSTNTICPCGCDP